MGGQSADFIRYLCLYLFVCCLASTLWLVLSVQCGRSFGRSVGPRRVLLLDVSVSTPLVWKAQTSQRRAGWTTHVHSVTHNPGEHDGFNNKKQHVSTSLFGIWYLIRLIIIIVIIIIIRDFHRSNSSLPPPAPKLKQNSGILTVTSLVISNAWNRLEGWIRNPVFNVTAVRRASLLTSPRHYYQHFAC